MTYRLFSFVTVATLGLVAGCGGKTVTTTDAAGSGGSSQVGGSGGTSITGGTGGMASGGTGGTATGGTGTAGTGGAPEWDHTCYCKNWTDDNYPRIFFDYPYSCAVKGCHSTPDLDYVCCAVSCLRPSLCDFLSTNFIDFADPNQPKKPCTSYYPTACVPRKDCALEGIVKPRPKGPNDNDYNLAEPACFP